MQEFPQAIGEFRFAVDRRCGKDRVGQHDAVGTSNRAWQVRIVGCGSQGREEPACVGSGLLRADFPQWILFRPLVKALVVIGPW